MQSDDPAFLSVGTEVSAKFKGAFCEAKIKKVAKSLRIKVNLKEPPFGSIYVDDTSVVKASKLEVNEYIDVLHNKQTIRAVIQNVKDCSKYHVVFNDGDEKELRRTQLCLKGGKHFDAAVNLDALPLYNPEQFSTPVVKSSVGKSGKSGSKKRKGDETTPLKRKKQKDEDEESDDDDDRKTRERRAAASAATIAFAGMDIGDTQSEDSSADSSEEKEREKERKRRREEEKEREMEREEEKNRLEKEKEREKEKEKAKKDRDRLKEKFEKVSREEPIEKPTRIIEERLLSLGKVVVIFEDAVAAKKICDGIKPQKFNTKSVSPTAALTATPSTSGNASTTLVTTKMSTPSSVYGIFYKKKWFPALVVPISAYVVLNEKNDAPKDDDIAVRRFYDGKIIIRSKIHALPFSWIPSFSRKKLDEINENWGPGGSVRIPFGDALEMAYTYVDTGKLPKGWSKDMKEAYSSLQKQEKMEVMREKKEKTPDGINNESNGSSSENEEDDANEEEDDEDELESDEEISSEERDLFIAQLYKFHEESASPINRVPHLGGKEIDLYLFYRIVQNYGGYKRVSANSRWCKILTKLKLKGCPGATPGTVKKAYARYLEPYSQFEAKLGWSFYGKDAATSSRGERRLLRPGQISEIEKKRRRKSATKEDGTGGSRGSKEPSVVRDAIRENNSGSPAVPYSEMVRKKERLFSESSSLSSDGMSVKDEKGIIEEETEAISQFERQYRHESKREISQSNELCLDMREKRSASLSTTDSGKRSKNGESPEDNDQDGRTKKKLRKERKVTAQSVGSDGSVERTIDSHDYDVGYQKPNVISHFYMGQKVRAIHCGRWYDARVVEIHQPKTLELVLLLGKGDDENSITDRVRNELKEISEKMGCFVHYLGWNSRYDEWIDLRKLKIHKKDQLQSRILIREHPNGQCLSDYKIALAEMYTYGMNEAVEFEKILESVREMPLKAVEVSRRTETSPRDSMSPNTVQVGFSNSTSMGRGMSLSSIMSQVGTGKDSNLTVRAVAAAAAGLEPRGRGSRILLSPPGSSRSQKTLLHQFSSEEGFHPLHKSVERTEKLGGLTISSGPLLPSMTHLEPETSEKRRKMVKELSRKVSNEENKNEMHFETKFDAGNERTNAREVTPPPDKFRRTRSSSRTFEELAKEPVLSSSYSPKNSPEPTRKSARKSTIASSTASLNAQRSLINTGSGPLNMSPTKFAAMKMQERIIEEGDEEKVLAIESRKVEEVEEKEEEKKVELEDKNQESADSATDIAPHEVTSEQSTLRDGIPGVPLTTSEEHVTTPTCDRTMDDVRISMTPVRSIKDDITKRASLSGPISRGSSGKRKRGRYSQMVVDRKYHKGGGSGNRKQQNEEDGDEVEDEDGPGTPSTRSDTFHNLKARMYKVMEQEGSLHDFALLGLPDYETLLKTTSDEQLDDLLENRAWDLREIYHQAKAEIVAMEKTKRRFYERKREKERHQARRSVTPRDSISQCVPRGGSVDRGASSIVETPIEKNTKVEI